jgi:hypothetical protein
MDPAGFYRNNVRNARRNALTLLKTMPRRGQERGSEAWQAPKVIIPNEGAEALGRTIPSRESSRQSDS